MKKFITLFYLFLIPFLLTGIFSCAFNGGGVSPVCLNIPEGEKSVICELANEMNTTPEALSQILQVANFGALESDVYNAQEANKFVDGIITDLKGIQETGNVITFMQAITYLNKKFDLLPTKIQVLFVIINPDNLVNYQINIPLSNYDIILLIKHLNKQKQIIQVYL